MGNVSVVTSVRDLEHFRDSWEYWAQENRTDSIYLTYSWAMACLLNPKRHIRIILQYDKGTLKAVYPFEIQKKAGFRVLQPLGNGFGHRFASFPLFYPTDALFSLLRRQCPYDILYWNYFYTEEKNIISLPHIYWKPLSDELVISLNPPVSEILGSLSPSMKENLARRIRNIERDLGALSLEQVRPGETDTHLNRLFKFNAERFAARNQRSYFIDEENRRFFFRLLASLPPDFYRFYVLKGGENILAYRLAYRTGRQLQLRLLAYDYSLKKYSLSHSLLKLIIEKAREEGFSSLSFMSGHEPFKYSWNPDSFPRYSLVAIPAFRARIRYMINPRKVFE